jgi:23S rRNA (pseudouridine1915-N3)-methyltransferase
VRIHVIAVGKVRDRAVTELAGRYAGRCGWKIATIEVQPRGRVDPARQSEIEADLLLSAVPEGALLVALDERGNELDSAGFAEILGRWRDGGARDVAFLIGGADGHGQRVRERADLTLALGRMTWPHELVRVLLAEQLYRASAILAGHPYHRG